MLVRRVQRENSARDLTRQTERQIQCDQIGRFLQIIGNKLSHKSSPNMMVPFWAIYDYDIM